MRHLRLSCDAPWHCPMASALRAVGRATKQECGVAIFSKREWPRKAGLNETGAAPGLHGPGCAHSPRAFRPHTEDGVTAGAGSPLRANRRARTTMTQRLTWSPTLSEAGRFGRRWGLLPLAIVLVCATPAESSPSSPPKSPKSPTSLHSGGAVTTPKKQNRRRNNPFKDLVRNTVLWESS